MLSILCHINQCFIFIVWSFLAFKILLVTYLSKIVLFCLYNDLSGKVNDPAKKKKPF